MKIIAVICLLFNSYFAFAENLSCKAAAESAAIKATGDSTKLFKDSRDNNDGTYEVYTEQGDVDYDWKVTTKQTEKGCISTETKLVDSDSA